MDKGAHFYCCDFQVHTPRDRRWQGDRPSGIDERKEYARAFIAACRNRGVQAVAITDHHDMAFIELIREAALSERDINGNPVAEHERITIFPGMELTLGIPCQAIIIFDANFPQDLFPLVLNALAINQAPIDDPTTGEIQRLEAITSFGQLCDLLDRHTYLRGRYIIFPNVSDSGTGTLLRSGHAGHYKDMPCVGGYLDGNFAQLGEGNRAILSGRNAEYGNKCIAVFQTSDSRSSNYESLGTCTTWVKWATPTAEALRQACLARESRISHEPPYTPSIIITSLHVSNSKFLGPLVLELNPQYDAIIGGRGTGKSTILEYLRWGLCDDPPPSLEGDGETDYRVKRRNLIDKTLLSLEASVQVNFLINGVLHSVRRNSSTGETLLKIADGDYSKCTETDVRSLLPIQSYSQKQLSQVGVRLDELKRFVREGIRTELDRVSKELLSLASAIRSEYSRVLRKRALQKNTHDIETETRSVSEQIRQLRAGLKGLDSEDQKIIELQPTFEEADQFINKLTSYVTQSRDALSSLVLPELDTLNIGEESLQKLPERGLIREITEDIRQVFINARSYLLALEKELNRIGAPEDPLNKKIKQWEKLRELNQTKYEQAKARSSVHQTTLEQLAKLETRIKTQRTNMISTEGELASLGNPEQEYGSLRAQWENIHRERCQLLQKQCDLLTTLSEGLIRATVRKCAVLDEATTKLRGIIAGANIRSAKIDGLYSHVTSSPDPISEWSNILTELEQLVTLTKNSTPDSQVPATPILKSIGFTNSEIQKMVSKLTNDSWLDLSLTVLEDQPVFEYRAREADYIPFADASAGQQATALLWALLNQGGPPLVIDQPEDDLDNQVVTRVVEQIWKAKPRRQLIFASHNANLVVNGDAELVSCCDYRVTGEQSTGMIKREGAIDIDEVREEITKVMEGGKEAFKLRKDKYGF